MNILIFKKDYLPIFILLSTEMKISIKHISNLIHQNNNLIGNFVVYFKFLKTNYYHHISKA